MKTKHYTLLAIISVTCMLMALFPPWLNVLDSGANGNWPETLVFAGYSFFYFPEYAPLKMSAAYFPMIDMGRLLLQMLVSAAVETGIWFVLTKRRSDAPPEEGERSSSPNITRIFKITTIAALAVTVLALSDDMGKRWYFLTRSEGPTMGRGITARKDLEKGAVLDATSVEVSYGLDPFCATGMLHNKKAILGKRLKRAVKFRSIICADDLENTSGDSH